MTSPKTPDKNALASEIARQLREKNRKAIWQIARIIEWCGADFAQPILAQTQQVQALGGMLTADGFRRRTPGGIFFYLARGQMDPQICQRLFPSQWQRQQQARARKQAALAAVMPSDVAQHYAALKAVAATYQRQINALEKAGQTTGLAMTRELLKDTQREISAIEQQYVVKTKSSGAAADHQEI